MAWGTLHPGSVNSSSESSFSDGKLNSESSGESRNGEFGGELDKEGVRVEAEYESLGEGELKSENLVAEIEGKGENLVESEGKSENLVGNEGRMKNAIPLVVFLMGVWATLKNGFEKALVSDWLSWWPFWRQEKRLERLIAEADANPKDAVKQGALLAELNKHRLGPYNLNYI